jgi:hypothetical protein
MNHATIRRGEKRCQGMRLDPDRALKRPGTEAVVNRGLDANARVRDRNVAARTLLRRLYRASHTI